MKTIRLIPVILLLGFLHLTASGQTNPVGLEQQADTTEEGEPEYELIVMEPGYESYLVTQPPMEHYSESYYSLWNERYVTAWNIRFHSGPRKELFENEISYDPFIDYGIELEYKLYHFFRFFEKRYNIVLVYRGR